jgi:hypothetical protein
MPGGCTNLQYASSGKSADSITATAAAWDPANPLTSTDAADAAYLDPTATALRSAASRQRW